MHDQVHDPLTPWLYPDMLLCITQIIIDINLAHSLMISPNLLFTQTWIFLCYNIINLDCTVSRSILVFSLHSFTLLRKLDCTFFFVCKIHTLGV